VPTIIVIGLRIPHLFVTPSGTGQYLRWRITRSFRGRFSSPKLWTPRNVVVVSHRNGVTFSQNERDLAAGHRAPPSPSNGTVQAKQPVREPSCRGVRVEFRFKRLSAGRESFFSLRNGRAYIRKLSVARLSRRTSSLDDKRTTTLYSDTLAFSNDQRHGITINVFIYENMFRTA